VRNFIIGLLLGLAVSAAAQSIDRSRMNTAKQRVKTLALELKNDPSNSTAAEQRELLYTMAYVVLGDE
jgi:hypothetical protein